MQNIRSNWRGCKDWIDFGTPINTTSDEASKYYDAVLTQLAGIYNESSVGGLENSIKNMMDADPNFVLGHVIKNSMKCFGASMTLDKNPELAKDIENMETLAQKQNVTDMEKQHVAAVKAYAEGEFPEACSIWEDILIENPLDMLALRFAHSTYIRLSYYPQMRDGIARVLPYWKPSMPLYGYLQGMYAFGLEETNLYDAAEKAARRGLDYNRYDSWSTHALAHVMDMQGRQDEGISFLSSTENDWSTSGISGHYYWHYAVYHVEKGNYSEALGIYDSHILPRVKNKPSMLYMSDASSLLYRLQLEGVKESGRYKDMQEICRQHHDDHVNAFYDCHYMMTSIGSGDMESTQKCLQSLRNFVNDGKGFNCRLTKEVGLPLCEAMVACEDGNYSKAVDLVYPIRYQISKIGGSYTQRDVFNLFLINCAMHSEKKVHKKLGRQLLTERKCLKENSPLTDRWMETAMVEHLD